MRTMEVPMELDMNFVDILFVGLCNKTISKGIKGRKEKREEGRERERRGGGYYVIFLFFYHSAGFSRSICIVYYFICIKF